MFVGLDVAKAGLVIAVRTNGERWPVAALAAVELPLVVTCPAS